MHTGRRTATLRRTLAQPIVTECRGTRTEAQAAARVRTAARVAPSRRASDRAGGRPALPRDSWAAGAARRSTPRPAVSVHSRGHAIGEHRHATVVATSLRPSRRAARRASHISARSRLFLERGGAELEHEERVVHLAQRRRALVERREVQLLVPSAQISATWRGGGRSRCCLARERRAAARDVLERVGRVALLDVRAQLLGERLLPADFITRQSVPSRADGPISSRGHHAPRQSARPTAARGPIELPND